MKFYGIGYGELLSVPIRCFWMLFRNINRVQAQDDMRQLTLVNCAFVGGDGAKKFRDSLILELGDVQTVKFDPMAERIDKSAFNSLKEKISRERRKK